MSFQTSPPVCKHFHSLRERNLWHSVLLALLHLACQTQLCEVSFAQNTTAAAVAATQTCQSGI